MTEYNQQNKILEKQFNIAIQNRKVLRSILKGVPKEQLVIIPDGFRNNLWWNICHVVAIQQILIYRWSGLPGRIDESWIDTYKKGTFPSEDPSSEEIEQLLDWLINTVLLAQEDYNNGLFKEYKEYTTSIKVTLSSVEDAINFNNFHEGIHLGVVLSQLKSLGISVF